MTVPNNAVVWRADDDYNKDWLKKWLRFEPHIILGGDENPYLLRWYVLPRNKRFNIYLHCFLRSDEDRALHDHPWDFWSFLLKGNYTEHTKEGSIRRKRFSLAHRAAEHAHRVELDGYDQPRPHDYQHWLSTVHPPNSTYKPPGVYAINLENYHIRVEKPAWTLFFTTAKRREWGFHCPKGWMHWEKFTAGTKGEKSVGCGEFE